VNEFLEDHEELQVAGPPAASVCFPRLAGESDSGPFVQTLLEQYDVAVAPGHFFEAPAHFRISLAGQPDNLARGLERLSDALDARAR
jgi:aspartate/methionine/tyrosine aminotransferase